ncbi:MAG: hypothetical protein WCA07_15930 [Gloeobacterales cyanobacterium]
MQHTAYLGITGTGKTHHLREHWLESPDPDSVIVLVDHAQEVALWQHWHQASSQKDKPLHIGTYRAWIRRWILAYWSLIEAWRQEQGFPLVKQPKLPAIDGAQYFLKQMLNTEPELIQGLGLNEDESHSHIVLEILRTNVQLREQGRSPGDLEGLSGASPVASFQDVLRRYHQHSLQHGVFDYGEQLALWQEVLLPKLTKEALPLKLTSPQKRYRRWLADNLQEWCPVGHQLLQTLNPETLYSALDPQCCRRFGQGADPEGARVFVEGAAVIELNQVHTSKRWQALAKNLPEIFHLHRNAPKISNFSCGPQYLLWKLAVQWVSSIWQGKETIALLVPALDFATTSHLAEAFEEANIPLHFLERTNRVGDFGVVRLLRTLTRLVWQDAKGLSSPKPSIFEVAQLLEFGLGLSSGQASFWSPQIHDPVLGLATESPSQLPLACQNLLDWVRTQREKVLPLADLWKEAEFLLCEAPLSELERGRLSQSITLAHQFQELWEPNNRKEEEDFLAQLFAGDLTPLRPEQQELFPNKVLVGTPYQFLATGLISTHQAWLNVLSDQWLGIPKHLNPWMLAKRPWTPEEQEKHQIQRLIMLLQGCLRRNQGELQLFSARLDGRGERMSGLLGRTLANSHS